MKGENKGDCLMKRRFPDKETNSAPIGNWMWLSKAGWVAIAKEEQADAGLDRGPIATGAGSQEIGKRAWLPAEVKFFLDFPFIERQVQAARSCRANPPTPVP